MPMSADAVADAVADAADHVPGDLQLAHFLLVPSAQPWDDAVTGVGRRLLAAADVLILLKMPVGFFVGCAATTTSFRPSVVIRNISLTGGLPSRIKLNATNRPSGEKLAWIHIEFVLFRTRIEPSAVELNTKSVPFALPERYARMDAASGDQSNGTT